MLRRHERVEFFVDRDAATLSGTPETNGTE